MTLIVSNAPSVLAALSKASRRACCRVGRQRRTTAIVQRDSQGLREAKGDLLRLIVTPLALARRMERHRDEQVQSRQPSPQIRVSCHLATQKRPDLLDSTELEAVNRITRNTGKVRKDQGTVEVDASPADAVLAGRPR